jgi:N,N'-diacetylchitobiose transport system substrate-binding protein
VQRRLIVAIGVTAMAAGIAACGTGSADSGKAVDPKDRTGTVTVWLMNDAQTSWPELVRSVNAQFAAKYPKAKLKVQYQQWGDKVQKLDAALSGSSAPDVVELGNTETMTYILNGALAEIDPKQYDNSGTWIKGLKDTCAYQGKLYCVPYYAGARVAIYNADMFKKATGSAALPATETALTAALDKLEKTYGAKDDAYSPLYLPGRYWYAAMSYVAAYGGQIAKYDDASGKWSATLDTPAAQQGIQHFIDLVKKYNHGDQTKDETDHANVAAKEKTALVYGNGWESGVVITPPNGNKKLKNAIKTAAMPGPNGTTLPSFIGGSDLAVTSKSKVADLAKDWISMFTSEKSEAVLASKNILPNNEKQLEPLKARPATAPIANAVPDAWFTPIAPGWAAVEKQSILPDMLISILKGTPVADATKAADQKIDSLINNAS